MSVDDHAAWVAEAQARGDRHGVFTRVDRFEWTQFPGCGPSVDVFGLLEGQRMLELGCGTGANAAVLARRGALVHGVDVASTSIASARTMYRDLCSGLTFTIGPVEDYLASTEHVFDYAYSVFGAVSFTDPYKLLPLVRRCLVPGGRLIFSVKHPARDNPELEPGSARVVRQRLPHTGAVIARYELTPEAWRTALLAHGYAIDHMIDIVARAANGRPRTSVPPCCLLVCSTVAA